MEKYKIMYLLADNAGCGYARVKQPVKYLQKKYPDLFEIQVITRLSKDMYLTPDDKKLVDLVVCQRQYSGEVLSHIRLMKKAGIKIVYEVDDALDKISIYSSAYKIFNDNPHYLLTMQEFLKISDAITVSTEYLKQHYNADYVLPNNIDFEVWDTISKKDNGETIVIGWAGSSTHYADIKECVDAVEAVALKYPNVKVALGGWDAKEMAMIKESPRGTFPLEVEATILDPETKEKVLQKIPIIKNLNAIKALENIYYTIKEGKLSFLNSDVSDDAIMREFPKEELSEFLTLRGRSTMNGEQYYETGRRYFFNKLPADKIIDIPWVTNVEKLGNILCHFDIGIAPLEDTSFNSSKSNIKFLEYSALGIPTVASKVTPYSSTIVNGETGFLIKPKGTVYLDWVKALTKLVENKELREQVGKNANKFVKENFNIEKNVDLWKDTYLEILGVKNEKSET